MSKLILSLDGGGIRGAAISQFLSLVEKGLENQGKTIRDCVDFYAGTSTGSIIALALATTDLTIDEINDLYDVVNAKKIFFENQGFFEVDGINAPKYEAKGKTEILINNFGEKKIEDVLENSKHVLVVTYGIENRKPLIIKSTDPNCLDLYSYQVADASSAAPTYFPTQKLHINNSDTWLVDGGVIANNPTMCAIAEAKRAWGLSIADLRVLSIGTGYRTRKINGPESTKWGALQWFRKGQILDILSDERIVEYQSITLTDSGNYIRVNSNLDSYPDFHTPPDDAMDDVSEENIKRLKALGIFWFKKYGSAVIKLMLGESLDSSLDRLDPETGEPTTFSGKLLV